MAKLMLTERLRIAGLLTRQGWRRIRSNAGAPARIFAVATARSPKRLLIAPQDIRTADPQIAIDIYSGYFAFAGKIAATHGYSPFQIEPPSASWSRVLMSFGWLRHLRAADTALARANAKSLIQDWINLVDRPRARHSGDIAFEPRVVARRILSWLCQSPIILEGADHDFYRRFTQSLGKQAAYLQRCIAEGLGGDTKLLAAIALAELTLCVDGLASLQRKSTRVLARELALQILPDGGHISRNPRVLVELLLDLLPLRQAYAARGVQPPPELLNAIDRMMPMLRMFRHGDGTLALFNGMGVTAPELLATLLAYDDARAGAIFNAPHSGYQRLEVADSVVLIDTGKPPPVQFSSEAHASSLAFEFSTGAQRLIVNCGAADPGRPAAQAAARATAAHSALVIADTSSCSFAVHPGLQAWLQAQFISGPSRVEVERAESAQSIMVTASHDGYARRFGFVHKRQIVLSMDGKRLAGEDTITRVRHAQAPGAAYCVRFHLHPNIKASMTHQGKAVLMACPSGEAWIFEGDGLPLGLEESVFFAAPDGPRRTSQIVISAESLETPLVRWSITQVNQGQNRSARRREPEQQLF